MFPRDLSLFFPCQVTAWIFSRNMERGQLFIQALPWLSSLLSLSSLLVFTWDSTYRVPQCVHFKRVDFRCCSLQPLILALSSWVCVTLFVFLSSFFSFWRSASSYVFLSTNTTAIILVGKPHFGYLDKLNFPDKYCWLLHLTQHFTQMLLGCTFGESNNRDPPNFINFVRVFCRVSLLFYIFNFVTAYLADSRKQSNMFIHTNIKCKLNLVKKK